MANFAKYNYDLFNSFSMRNQVPISLQGGAKEPAMVKADGNCLFRAVAMAIDTKGKYVGEDLAFMLRLSAAVHGVVYMDYFLESVSIVYH
jgi:hypothetical protein